MAAESSPPRGAKDARSCRELIEMMPLGFQAEEAGDLEAVFQFEVGDPENFIAHISVSGGRATFHDGPAEAPDVTVKTPPDVWLKIGRGEMNGELAFMTGKLKAKGNLGLLLKMNKLFRG